MDQYKVGDLVYARLGTLPAVGTVVDVRHGGAGRCLIRFSAVQQDWYAEEELTPFEGGKAAPPEGGA